MSNTQPTGLEPWTPVTIDHTTATERASFRRCRRQWFLSVVHRLQRAGGNPNFWFGEMVHASLAAYYTALQGGSSWGQACDQGVNTLVATHTSIVTRAQTELPGMFADYAQEYADALTLAIGMVNGYFNHDKQSGLGRIISVEQRYSVPILNPAGELVPNAQLTGRFDLVVEKANGDLWIVDHKTASREHNSAQLDLDDQLTAYAYTWWRATGVWPRGQLYNVLLKRVPHEPKLLKNGKLSVDKLQSTTYDLFLQAIRTNGLATSDYSEMLLFLREMGDRSFFIQEGVFRTPGQIDEFERNLWYEWSDMARVASEPERAYPNPSPFNCPSCPVQQICRAMMDGQDQDVPALITANFWIAPPRE